MKEQIKLRPKTLYVPVKKDKYSQNGYWNFVEDCIDCNRKRCIEKLQNWFINLETRITPSWEHLQQLGYKIQKVKLSIEVKNNEK